MDSLVGPGRGLIYAAYYYNRLRFAALRLLLGGKAKFGEACDVWASCLKYTGPGQAVFGDGCVVERSLFPLVLDIAQGGRVELGERVWIRGKYRPNVITCFENASVDIGPESFVNGTIISARAEVTIGRNAMISWDTAIIDSNLHSVSNDEPLDPRPVKIGDYVMIGASATVLPGSSIGSHTVIGAGSVVAGSLPDHVVAAGSPARVVREIGDRDKAS